MATLKHISSKNADYGAAEKYLTFAYDEFTMKPVTDENGRLVPREDYRISTLNCENFAIDCMRANLRFGKNQKRQDVKSHHYIISFDPRDTAEHDLTPDRAQELGERFCAEHFPGHQALICTHPDGHNHSGNIHVHIVINSLRIEDVPLLPYMDRPADTRAGCKHRCTNAAMKYLRSEVMELCHREGLYQIDLLHGSRERITEGEYRAKQRKDGKFETDKAKLRREIRSALSASVSFSDFADKLAQCGITVRESRGRLSYLTADRTKPITAHRLGDDFDKAAVFSALERNAKQPKKAIPAYGTPGRLVDMEFAQSKGVGYEKWAKLHNLKQLAATYCCLTENDLLDSDRLNAAVESSLKDFMQTGKALHDLEQRLDEKRS